MRISQVNIIVVDDHGRWNSAVLRFLQSAAAFFVLKEPEPNHHETIAYVYKPAIYIHLHCCQDPCFHWLRSKKVCETSTYDRSELT